MALQIVDVAPDVVAAPQLLEIVGEKRALQLSPSHPLASGFRRLVTRGEPFSWSGVRDVMELELFSRAVVEHFVGRVPEHKWVPNIRNERACESLLFEAMVLKQIVEPRVSYASWTRYEEGTPDILGFGPDVQFECTRILGGVLPKMMRRATSAQKLRQNLRAAPYVIVVGTDVEFEAHLIEGLTREVSAVWDAWMGRHRDVSGVLLTARRNPASFEWVREIDDEQVAVDCVRSYAMWARNLSASLPLPDGFESKMRNTP